MQATQKLCGLSDTRLRPATDMLKRCALLLTPPTGGAHARTCPHPARSAPPRTARCRMADNIAKGPAEEKYRKVRLTNPKVAAGLVHVPGARQFLRAIGWQASHLTLHHDCIVATHTLFTPLVFTLARRRLAAGGEGVHAAADGGLAPPPPPESLLLSSLRSG